MDQIDVATVAPQLDTVAILERAKEMIGAGFTTCAYARKAPDADWCRVDDPEAKYFCGIGAIARALYEKTGRAIGTGDSNSEDSGLTDVLNEFPAPFLALAAATSAYYFEEYVGAASREIIRVNNYEMKPGETGEWFDGAIAFERGRLAKTKPAATPSADLVDA